jgi:hypothetical protein
MLPSSSSEDFGLWGKIFRGYFAFTFVTARCLAHHPEDGFVDRLKRFGFPPPLYPSYEVLTFSSVGLTPTEHISLSPFSFLDMPELNPHGLLPNCVRFGTHQSPGEWQHSLLTRLLDFG